MSRDEQIIFEAPNRWITHEYLELVLGSEAEVNASIRRCLDRGCSLPAVADGFGRSRPKNHGAGYDGGSPGRRLVLPNASVPFLSHFGPLWSTCGGMVMIAPLHTDIGEAKSDTTFGLLSPGLTRSKVNPLSRSVSRYMETTNAWLPMSGFEDFSIAPARIVAAVRGLLRKAGSAAASILSAAGDNRPPRTRRYSPVYVPWTTWKLRDCSGRRSARLSYILVTK